MFNTCLAIEDYYMNIVSITLVKNEEKIVESFIRYNSYFIYKMIIIDNGCKDNTIPIINKLIDEGYNIELYSEANVGYKQAYLENKYMYKTIADGGVDWIIPLDVDEFLDMDKDFLNSLDCSKGYYVYWKNYVLLEDCDLSEKCIPKRLTSRLMKKRI